MPAVRIDELELAIEFVSASIATDNEAYVSLETGEVFYVGDVDDLEPPPSNVDDPKRYVAIPMRNELGLGKRLVLQFAEECLPEKYDEIQEIFRRKGAYARYEDLLDRIGALERWYSYENEETRKAIREWCSDNGIEIAA